MKKIRYIVVKTGVRTWQIAEFSTLDVLPIFELRKQRFHSEFDAMQEAENWQKVYDEAPNKVIHDLAVIPADCSPRRTREGKTLMELAAENRL